MLQEEWKERLATSGLRRDAAAYRVLTLLPRHLVLTSSVVADGIGVSPRAALQALRDLAEVDVLVEVGTMPSSTRGKPARLFTARELLGLAGASPVTRLAQVRRQTRNGVSSKPLSSASTGSAARPCTASATSGSRSTSSLTTMSPPFDSPTRRAATFTVEPK